jgi:DNA-binding NtrC family response regulator
VSASLQSIKNRFGIIGHSPALDQALSTAVRVAPTDLTVLITGESGVGKEAFSKIIHSLSPRKHNKFMAINCGAIPGGTINSELFGHERGAFTGATGDRKGYFETVDGGTLFLDEIGEMPADTQAFLLRVLESGEFIRVGSSKVLNTNVRVIAATNVDLREQVSKGKFREDLYYRLNTVPIKVPALRERPGDILMLFRKFAGDFAEKYRSEQLQLDERAQLLIENYTWPGNIRELKNVAEQLSVLSEDRNLDAEHLLEFFPELLSRNLPAIRKQGSGGKEPLEEREILYNLLFEMKRDLNDLKSLVFGLIRNNDLSVPDSQSLALPPPESFMPPSRNFEGRPDEKTPPRHEPTHHAYPDQEGVRVIIGNEKYQEGYGRSEEVEENLSLEEMEKDLITRALKKHHGRRKDAASELGISERTLYRKINHYNLDL